MIKKITIAILSVLLAIVCFSQNYPLNNRSTGSNTLNDPRLQAGLNFFTPRYLDTIQANIPTNKGIDSCGAIIYTYVGNHIWKRSCSPKRWELVGSGSGLAFNGVTMLGDTIQQGGSIIKATHIQIENHQTTGSAYTYLHYANKPAAQSIIQDLNPYPTVSIYNPTTIAAEALYEESDGDTSYLHYGGRFVSVVRNVFDSTSTRFSASNKYILLPSNGFEGVYQFMIPRDTTVWRVGRDGQSANVIHAQWDLGDTYGYNTHIVPESGIPGFPLTTTLSSIDLARNIDNTRRKKMTGDGISGYTSRYKTYQSSINMSTYEAGNYWSKLIGYTAYGDIYPLVSGATKNKTLSVATVDSSFGFVAMPQYRYTNTIRNGYGFWMQGDSDYNHINGWLTVGGSLPTRANGGQDYQHRFNVNGDIWASDTTHGFIVDALGYSVRIPPTVGTQAGIGFWIQDSTQQQADVLMDQPANWNNRLFRLRVGNTIPAASYSNDGTGFRIEFQTGANSVNISKIWRNGNWTIGTGLPATNLRLYKKFTVDGGGAFFDTLRLVNLVQQGADTSYKPVVADGLGNLYKGYWAYAGSGSGGITNFSFSDGNGINGSVTNPTTTPQLQLSTSILTNSVVVANSGAFTGGNTFTYNGATLYGYTTNDVNFESESGTDLNGLQIIPTKSLFYNSSASTNTVETVLELRRLTGISANGIGGSLDFVSEDGGGTTIRSNRLQSKYTSVTPGATTSEFSILGQNAGSEQASLTLAGTGALKLHSGYGINTFPGTPAYGIGVDASSNVITYAISSGSSSFTFNDSLKWVYSVAYGLVGDGVTDNVAAIRAMRNEAASTGWPIVFAPGIYYSSDSVTFNKMTVIGYNATIKTTSTTVTIFNVKDSCDVSGFTFVGTGRATGLPGGVFTTQDGIRIFGSNNNIHNNKFLNLNGSGVDLWNVSAIYNNVVHDNRFTANTIGIYAMANSEYLTAYGNKGEYNYVGLYDRASSNNQWVGNNFNYSVNANLRILGGGDHGHADANTFNHGGQYNLLIESVTLNYSFIGNIFYTGNIGFGTVDTVHNVIISGGTISGATITGSRVVNVRVSDVIYGSGPVVQSTTGVVYVNNINSTDPYYLSSATSSISSSVLSTAMTDETGSGVAVFGTSPSFTTSITAPLVIGGTGTTSDLVLQSTSGVGATGAEIIFKGGNNGATTFMTISNAGEIGIGTAPVANFKLFMVSNTTSSSNINTLFRNSGSQNLFQIHDNGDTKLGNQSTTTSVNFLLNRNYAGPGLVTPTSFLTLGAGISTTNGAPLKFLSGTNLVTPEAGAVEFDGTNFFGTVSTTRYTFAKTLTSTATLDFDLTAVNYQDLTVTLTGAAVNDAVAFSVDPAALVADVTYFATVTATNTVTIRCSRVGGGGAANPASGTFRVAILRY